MKNLNNQKIVSYEIYGIADRVLENNIFKLSIEYSDRTFLFFKGIASETEHFPFGKVRNTCSSTHLAELDVEKKQYLVLVRKDILEACKKVKQIMSE